LSIAAFKGRLLSIATKNKEPPMSSCPACGKQATEGTNECVGSSFPSGNPEPLGGLTEPVERAFEAQPGENIQSDVELVSGLGPGTYQASFFIHVQYVDRRGEAKRCQA
jgi:hypothetical protein